ncbi:MAG: ComEA family DNA-binding protein [Planctomycetota bacterium]
MSDSEDSVSAICDSVSSGGDTSEAPATLAGASTRKTATECRRTSGSILPSLPESSRTMLLWLLAIMLGILAIEWIVIAGRRPQPWPIQRGTPFRIGFQVEMNSATWIEWSQLEGIGPGLAHRIVAYRTVNGPFRAIDDLQLVPGIGPSKLDAIRHQLTIRHEHAETHIVSPDRHNGKNTSAETKQPSAIR